MIADLTTTEQGELEKHERVIERGLNTFMDVGLALLAIRDKKLYRLEYGTFEEYCRKRWSLKQSRAYQLMDAANVVRNLGSSTIVELPATESQARPLVGLDPDQQREAWAHAVETAPDGKMTAAHVERVVDQMTGEILPRANGGSMAVHYSSETAEWYTPPQIVSRVVEALGKIDLDPCSNSHTNPRIPAQHHYTIEDNGLEQKWTGRVYMNPPYGREIAEWVECLVEQYEFGSITAAIALVPSRTDTEWFYQLRDYPRCFVKGRLSFSDNENPAPFPSMVVYLGRDVDGFVEVFGDIGDVFARTG